MQEGGEKCPLDIIEMLKGKSCSSQSLKAEENLMKQSIFVLLSVKTLASNSYFINLFCRHTSTQPPSSYVAIQQSLPYLRAQ
jgi:hypothetical protein